jgi:prepilin-type N-terminal cleavage/methylation domain-containing protein
MSKSSLKSLPTKKPNPKPSAFSLLELSIVILIIGLLIAGVIGSKHIIKKSRISSAHSLTNSAPINSITDNALWLESSYDDRAFTDETTDNSNNNIEDGDNLTSWVDSSYNQNKPTITAVGNGPTYANTINFVQAVKFNDSEDNYLQINNAEFLNNT